MKNFINEYKLLFIPIVTIILSTVFYFYLPDTIATHWGFSGQADGFSSKAFGLFFFPVLLLLLTFILYFIPKTDPKIKNIDGFFDEYINMIFSFQVFFLVIQVFTILWNLDIKIPVNIFFSLGFSYLMFTISGLISKAKPNWFIGIRTPWTMSSDRVWDVTHKFAGKVYRIFSILFILGVFHFSIFFLLLFIFILLNILLVLYSYVEYKKEVR